MSVDRKDDQPSDAHLPDNYVSYTLKTTKPLPPVTLENFTTEVIWVNVFVLLVLPFIGFAAAFYTKLRWETAVWGIAYYYITGIGITAGYHRLWAHRSYNASIFLQYFLAIVSAGAVQGSIKWWSRGHRAHHRYTDTDLDPYNAHKGFFYSHIGWMLTKPRRRPGVADVSDLSKSYIVRWQHQYYLWLLFSMALGFPALVAGLGWGDWKGGLVYAGLLRLTFVHHSTFCVNSLAHWLGESPFDDKHTPRDHMITALVTIGEGYHNFHHQFPMDYRNAIKWYQYDPTKWFIWACQKIGLASHLKVFPDNEIRKGQLTMQLKQLHETQEQLQWPGDSNALPVITWDSFQTQSQARALILISGFIHDASSFLDDHPGGRHLIVKYIGKDATPAFFGGVYDHSNAAHNLLAMKRVGILHGGHPHALDDKMQRSADSSSFEYYSTANPERAVPPSQRLKIARYTELSSSSSGTSGGGSYSGSDVDSEN